MYVVNNRLKPGEHRSLVTDWSRRRVITGPQRDKTTPIFIVEEKRAEPSLGVTI